MRATVFLAAGAAVSIGAAMMCIRSVGVESKTARRLACAGHHLVVTLLSLASLQLSSEAALMFALFLEVGFELADSAWAFLFGSGWTGLRGFPLYLHHILSAVLGCYFAHLCRSGDIAFQEIAPFLAIFVGGGACDLLWAKVLPRAGFLRYSLSQYIATAVYTAAFLLVRVYLFTTLSTRFLQSLSSSNTLSIASYITFVLFSAYHALLFVGVLASWRYGGQMPPPRRQ